MIVIDGVNFNVPVLGISRTADVLDKFAERTADGILHREIIGVYFNFQLAFGQTTDTVEYAALWNKLTEPVEFHTVTVPDIAGDYTFTAYFSGISDGVRKVTGVANYWKGLTVKFTAQAPARTP